MAKVNVSRSYNSFQEFLNDDFDTLAAGIRKEWQTDWMGGGLYDDAESLISDLRNYGGVLPPMRKVYTPQEMALVSRTKDEYFFDVYGECGFDIGLACMGIPECVLRNESTQEVKENFTIRMRHGITSGVDNVQATKKFMLLADLYRAAIQKYNVRLIIEWAGVHSLLGKYHVSITLCDFGDYMDELTLASVTSATMFRAMLMGLCKKHLGDNASGVYGFRDWLDQTSIIKVGENEIILPRIGSPAGASAYSVPALLKAAGLTEGA
jgi:hypothetical protein